jgi:hypothetical protein
MYTGSRKRPKTGQFNIAGIVGTWPDMAEHIKAVITVQSIITPGLVRSQTAAAHDLTK